MPSFDLSAVEEDSAAQARPIDRFLNFAQGGLILIWVVAMTLVIPRAIAGRNSLFQNVAEGALYLTLFGVTVLFGVVVIWFTASRLRDYIPHTGRGPIRIDVNDDGFTLAWQIGPGLKRLWAKQRTPLEIKDFSAAGYSARMKLSQTVWVALSGEAVSSLTQHAKDGGLIVTTVPIVGPTGTPGSDIRIHLLR
jgi:hypothetical protein